jgi:hypothetical protein
MHNYPSSSETNKEDRKTDDLSLYHSRCLCPNFLFLTPNDNDRGYCIENRENESRFQGAVLWVLWYNANAARLREARNTKDFLILDLLVLSLET